MNTENQNPAKPINGMENGEDVKTVVHQESSPNSPAMGESPPAPGRKKIKAKGANGVLVERQFQRRNNINNLDGLIREHGRLIALIRNGEITLEKGEVLSRAMSRHKEMVAAAVLQSQHAELIERLRALQGNPSGQFLIDEAAKNQ